MKSTLAFARDFVLLVFFFCAVIYVFSMAAVR